MGMGSEAKRRGRAPAVKEGKMLERPDFAWTHVSVGQRPFRITRGRNSLRVGVDWCRDGEHTRAQCVPV